MSEPLMERARSGEEAAFRQLTEPYRRELQVHCYRMLGSVQDAEDALQETLVSAWRGLDDFEQRSSVRTWLYSIATHRCLNLIRERSRRPQPASGATLPFVPPPPTRMSDISWLEPYPEQLLDSLPDTAPGPEARYELREAVGLAFITGLQRLPERQRAVLVMRDVLGFRAGETAEMLGTSEPTVNSALQRARAALAERASIPRERAPAPGSAQERAIASDFADAFERGDMDRVVAMLSDDAWVTMPPEPYEYQGREAIADFFRHTMAAGVRHRAMRLVATRASGQPAFIHYAYEDGEMVGRLSGLLVLTLAGTEIAALTRFALPNLPPQFELPPTHPW